MFLIRLIHIKSIKIGEYKDDSSIKIQTNKIKPEKEKQKKQDPVKQIKSVTQEKLLDNIETDKINANNLQIKSINDLIELCNRKKELKLKYEIENNVNLVSFDYGRIEISINEKLEKDFIKNLSSKLLEWTNVRWMITLSKKTGGKSKKESEVENKKKLFEETKDTESYKKILQIFSDAELIDIKKTDE